MSAPQRIQRRRTKGWRMPEGAVYVGRPSRWGNPVVIGRWASVGTNWLAADRCTMSTVVRGWDGAELYFRLGMEYGGLVVEDDHKVRVAVPLPSPEVVRAELAGRDLACWCPLDQPCHADVLLRIANSAPTTTDEQEATSE